MRVLRICGSAGQRVGPGLPWRGGAHTPGGIGIGVAGTELQPARPREPPGGCWLAGRCAALGRFRPGLAKALHIVRGWLFVGFSERVLSRPASWSCHRLQGVFLSAAGTWSRDLGSWGRRRGGRRRRRGLRGWPRAGSELCLPLCIFQTSGLPSPPAAGR